MPKIMPRRVKPATAPIRRDPAPSKWGYRVQRFWLTPFYRRMVRIGLPLAAILGVAGLYLMDVDRREAIVLAVNDFKASLQERPEFMVETMAIDGGDARLSSDVRLVLPVDFPVSSFDLDLEEMRQTVEALPRVRDATIRVRPGGILQVDVTERVPVAIWRTRDGLRLLDNEAAFVGPLAARADRGDLPVIAGKGAKDHLAEALAIFEAAEPLSERLRGLVRIGERRWDLVLDRNQRILLPSDDPTHALERVIVLAEAEDMLNRDLAVVDFRNARRPTVRLNVQAAAELRQIRQLEARGD